MDREADRHHRTEVMNPSRARCGELRSAGSEGGPGKRTGRDAETAPRSDPYTYLRTGEGWLYLFAVRGGWSAGRLTTTCPPIWSRPPRQWQW